MVMVRINIRGRRPAFNFCCRIISMQLKFSIWLGIIKEVTEFIFTGKKLSKLVGLEN